MESEQDIIKGCINNNRASQEKLYRQLYPGLFSLCRKFFTNEHDILTALNTGMLNVFRNIDKYDPEKGAIYSWAYTFVRNAALNQLKQSQACKETPSEITPELAQIPDSSPLGSHDYTEVYAALDRLPAATRAVCILFYLEEFSIKEIAAQLSLSEGTVKWHLSESRKKLTQYLVK